MQKCILKWLVSVSESVSASERIRTFQLLHYAYYAYFSGKRLSDISWAISSQLNVHNTHRATHLNFHAAKVVHTYHVTVMLWLEVGDNWMFFFDAIPGIIIIVLIWFNTNNNVLEICASKSNIEPLIVEKINLAVLYLCNKCYITNVFNWNIVHCDFWQELRYSSAPR